MIPLSPPPPPPQKNTRRAVEECNEFAVSMSTTQRQGNGYLRFA